ncbi:MAG TPA: Hpt domain-containing protein, partial [Pseudomonadota bacterium]|nr:Hpt domain-containing protein [Pseudomonadota bacterium]
MSEVIDLKQFLTGFLSETSELLRTANVNLLLLESAAAKGSPNPRAVRELYRALHTIKGLSAMVGVDPIVDLAHAVETVLRAADRGSGQMSQEAIELSLKGVKAIEDRVDAVAKKKEVPRAPVRLLEALGRLEPVAARPPVSQSLPLLRPELQAKLSPAELQEVASGVAAGRRLFQVEFLPSTTRASQGVTITWVRERIGEVGEIVKIVPRSMKQSVAAPGGLAFDLLVLTDTTAQRLAEVAQLRAEEVVAIGPGPPAVETSPPAAEPIGEELDELAPDSDPVTFVRVEVTRLDDALNKLSELIISRFKLKREIAALAARGVDVRALLDIDVLYGLQLDDLRGAIMRTRMVPMAELLARIPLLVRALGRDTGRAVRLEIDAQDVELDKSVGDRIFPAIVHLVRNAIDHAIEPPAERERRGKPREGLVRIVCNTRASNQLELAFTDDGRGIDAAAVARRAGREPPPTD